MTKDEALDLIVNTKAISPLTRNFVMWLYENDYRIISPSTTPLVDSGDRDFLEEDEST